MKTCYEASNAVEAHMVADLLTQEGVAARVLGEHLQGAIGELPAAGLVRVVVDEADHARARGVVQRWEASQPADDRLPRPPRGSRLFTGLVIGVLVGAGLSYAVFRAPASIDGIDHNGDGVLDEAWTFAPSGHLLRTETDRNLDGQVDEVVHFDRRGLPESARADDDFDGVFETRSRHRQGLVSHVETDTDGDGYAELRLHHTHGVLTAIDTLDPASGQPLRVERYRLGVRVEADLDTDRDGVLDLRLTYSPLDEVRSREVIARP